MNKTFAIDHRCFYDRLFRIQYDHENSFLGNTNPEKLYLGNDGQLSAFHGRLDKPTSALSWMTMLMSMAKTVVGGVKTTHSTRMLQGWHKRLTNSISVIQVVIQKSLTIGIALPSRLNETRDIKRLSRGCHDCGSKNGTMVRMRWCIY